MRAVTHHLEARGAHEVTEVARTFLFEGSATVVDARSTAQTCMGVLALGLGDVRDLDLALYTRSGQVVAEDTGTAPYAYVRACVDAGVQLYASAQMFEGRGEVVVLRMRDAPRELGRFAEEIPWSVSPGGRLEATRAVGTSGEASVLEGPAVEEERALAELGYVSVGAVLPMLLRGGLGVSRFSLDQPGCYRVVVIVPFARGVALTLTSPGGGSWVDTLGDARALGVAEARFIAASRGLALDHVGEGWVEGAVPLTWPIPLTAGRCYGVWALGPRGLQSVDVRLTDAHGVLLARTEGPPHGASVFHCATASGVVRLELRPKGEDGMVSLWVGTSEDRAP